MYPAFGKFAAGRLRLCYECNPMSFIMEKAGGVAMANGRQRLLELKPAQLHQRVPIFIGSKGMMDTWQQIVTK